MSIQVDSDLFSIFLTHATIVLIKTMLLSHATSYFRLKKQIFANEEDKKLSGSKAKVQFGDPDIERVRRCHRNDMENVYPFVMLGLLYCFTGPNVIFAAWHFRIFTIFRLLHTFVYLKQIPQPARGATYAIGWTVCASMGLQILRYAWKF